MRKIFLLAAFLICASSLGLAIVSPPVDVPITITPAGGGSPTISGVSLSNGNNFTTPATAGSTIDTLTANCSAGSCVGSTFSLATTGSCSGAANNSSFAISGSNLNIGGSTVNAGTYNIGIAVTLSGATNSGVCFPFALNGANTGNFLTTDRDATSNWQTAGLITVGGVPTTRTQCGATVSPIGGGADDTTNIQNAINACTAGHFVLLSSGTFTIAAGNYINMNKDGITLRGAGAGITTLTHPTAPASPCTGCTQLIIMGPPRFTAGPSLVHHTALTVDGAKGASTITLACGGNCATTFTVGAIVMLDELSLASGQPEPVPQIVSQGFTQHLASVDWRITYPEHIPFCGGCGDESDQSSSTFGRQDRNTNELKEIASISGNNVTFTSPLTISYRVANTAQLTRFEDVNTNNYLPHVKSAGIELLTTQWGDNDGIDSTMCAYCWLKNVENTAWSGVGINFSWSFRNELREFYSHDSFFANTTGGAYAIGLDFASSEILLENGISLRANKVMVARGAGAGSVVGYNYMDEGLIQGSNTDCIVQGCWEEIGLNGSHWVGPHHILFEGNWAWNGDSDHTHGTSVYMTYARNWLTGFRSAFLNHWVANNLVDDINQPANGPARAAGPSGLSYYFTFIGNVLGISGHTTGWTYQCNLVASTKCMWAPGWGEADNTGAWQQDPQIVNSSFAGRIIRDGNWDWVTSSQHWDDTPGTIPNSYYLSSKPAFFGSDTWPWVDPVTGTTLTLPAKARYDAGSPNCNC